jgi:polyisoprenoid-binding protein YceI
MKRVCVAATVLLVSITGFTQERIFTKTGKISFFSKAPLEDIEAHNKAAISVIDKATGQMEFSALMKGFEFEKALMQEHFNENYVESGKYPKATFKGSISDWQNVNITKDGKYPVTVKGALTIHGETKEVEAKGVIAVAGGAVTTTAEFTILLNDYKISIPSIVKDKIAQNVRIVVNANYEKM